MRSKEQIEQKLNDMSKKDWYHDFWEMSQEIKEYWEGYRDALVFAIQAKEKTKLPWE